MSPTPAAAAASMPTMVADLVFTDRRAIDLARSDALRNLSVGYDATTGPCRARQVDIRVNHVALVREGRCGRGVR
jgi:hypothetical protein